MTRESDSRARFLPSPLVAAARRYAKPEASAIAIAMMALVSFALLCGLLIAAIQGPPT